MFRLALATLLLLLPLPFNLEAPGALAPDGEGTGMAAKPHLIIEAGVRVPLATTSWASFRVQHTGSGSLEVTSPTAALGPRLTPVRADAPQLLLTRLGRLQLEGG